MVVLAALIGCGDPGSGDAPTYEGDIRPIVEGRCLGCHQEGGIGTFPLERYDQVAAVGEVVTAAVESRLMPPWKALPGPAYSNDPSLTDAQIALFRAWLDAGMPEGDQPGDPVPPVGIALPRVDATLDMPEDYTPAIDPDDYRCFVLDWSDPGTTYVTGFEVHPGNDTIVHHVAAFLIRPDGIAGPGVVDTFHRWDADDATPGYSCFGGPSKTGESLEVPIQQMAQWVPGQGATVFPEGVGIPVVEGSVVVLQLHYNTLSADGNPDRTSVDLMTQPEVDRIGAFAPWLNASWTFGLMQVPPQTEVTVTADGDPLAFFDLLLDDIDLSSGFTIHAAMMHMHNIGEETEVRAEHADGSVSEIVAIEDWDFDWQLTYVLEDPIEFAPGDELALSCTFDNPGDTTVGWGEGSGEEMCVANLFVSAPR
jgi:hypothetical protein